MSPVAEAEARAASTVVSQQFPQGEAAVKLDRKRSRRGVLFRLLFLASLVVAVLSLMTLLYTVEPIVRLHRPRKHHPSGTADRRLRLPS